MRFCTGTFSAASVRGVTVPVDASPWRTWKRFTASATAVVEGAGRLVGGKVAGDDQPLAQEIVVAARQRRSRILRPCGMVGQPPRTAISE